MSQREGRGGREGGGGGEGERGVGEKEVGWGLHERDRRTAKGEGGGRGEKG